jgi:hypothetical protein
MFSSAILGQANPFALHSFAFQINALGCVLNCGFPTFYRQPGQHLRSCLEFVSPVPGRLQY